MLCGHVWQRPLIRSVSEDLIEAVLEMLRAFVRDMDNGRGLKEAGWVPFDDDTLRRLGETGLCEVDYENRVARIDLHCKLPEDLASTDEGALFLDYLNALRVLETIKETMHDRGKYRKAIVEGLQRMLQTAHYSFWEEKEGAMPPEVRQAILNPQRIRVIRDSARLLVKELLEALWEPTQQVPWQEESLIKSFGKVVSTNDYLNVKEALGWNRVVMFFKKKKEFSSLIESLGLIWYADKMIEREGIEHLGARVLVLERVINKGVLERLESMLSELYDFISESGWGVNWSGVFRLPY